MPTAQEIFDTVAAHLLAQMERSLYTNRVCAYRSPDGLKCAIGVLIPDHIYESSMESLSVEPLLRSYPKVEPYIEVTDIKTREFLPDLQKIHDRYNPKDWRAELKAFADTYNLDPAILELY